MSTNPKTLYQEYVKESCCEHAKYISEKVERNRV